MPYTGTIQQQATGAGADVMRQWVAFFAPSLAIDRERLSQVQIRPGSRRFVPSLFPDYLAGSGPSEYFPQSDGPYYPYFTGPGAGGGGGGGPAGPDPLPADDPDEDGSGSGDVGTPTPGEPGPSDPGGPGDPGGGGGGSGPYDPRDVESSSSGSSSAASSSSSSNFPVCFGGLLNGLGGLNPGAGMMTMCEFDALNPGPCGDPTDHSVYIIVEYEGDGCSRPPGIHVCDQCEEPVIQCDFVSTGGCCGMVWIVTDCELQELYCVCADGTWVQIL